MDSIERYRKHYHREIQVWELESLTNTIGKRPDAFIDVIKLMRHWLTMLQHEFVPKPLTIINNEPIIRKRREW